MKSLIRFAIESLFLFKFRIYEQARHRNLNRKSPHFRAGFPSLSDLDWIQTSNLLSRNQMRYSVAPRGLNAGANIGF